MQDIKFIRGDSFGFWFSMDEILYKPGVTVTFTAKEQFDDDATNSKAIITKNTTTAEVKDGKARFAFVINPSDTQHLKLDGEELKLLGQLEARWPDGRVHTYPQDGKKPIKITIYPDAHVKGA